MYNVVGIERVEYVNKSGKEVRGYRVHFTFDLDEGAGNSGKAVDTVFLSDSLFVQSGVRVGDQAMPVYNKYGRCTGFMEDCG